MYIKYPISKPPTMAITRNREGLFLINSSRFIDKIKKLFFKVSSIC